MKPQNSDPNHIFTFYIIKLIFIIMLHPVRLVFLIFKIKNWLTEGLEQPRGGNPALIVTAICHQRHANVSKQTTLLADVDDAPPHRN